MGRGVRRRPERLGAKLKDLRLSLGLTQDGLIEYMGLTEYLNQAEISDFENNVREPDLPTLGAYARLAGISTDELIFDDLKLSKILPHARQTRKLSGNLQKRRPEATTTTVLLQLSIESSEGAAHEEDHARGNIEKAHLKRYKMKKLKEGEYELTFSHRGEADLNEQIYALLGAITIEARRRKCALNVNAREKVTSRYW